MRQKQGQVNSVSKYSIIIAKQKQKAQYVVVQLCKDCEKQQKKIARRKKCWQKCTRKIGTEKRIC